AWPQPPSPSPSPSPAAPSPSSPACSTDRPAGARIGKLASRAARAPRRHTAPDIHTPRRKTMRELIFLATGAIIGGVITLLRSEKEELQQQLDHERRARQEAVQARGHNEEGDQA